MHLFKQRGGHYPWVGSGRASISEQRKREREKRRHGTTQKRPFCQIKNATFAPRPRKGTAREKDTQAHIQLPKKKSQIHDRRHQNRKGKTPKKEKCQSFSCFSFTPPLSLLPYKVFFVLKSFNIPASVAAATGDKKRTFFLLCSSGNGLVMKKVFIWGKKGSGVIYFSFHFFFQGQTFPISTRLKLILPLEKEGPPPTPTNPYFMKKREAHTQFSRKKR